MLLSGDYLIFEVAGFRCAVHLARVERVVQAVEPQALPGAPDIVMGVILMQGEAVPVFDPGLRFGGKASPIQLNEHLVVVTTAARKIALRVQNTHGIETFHPADLKSTSHLVPELEGLAGVAAQESGTVVVYDVEEFLSEQESEQLQKALGKQ